MSRFRVPHTLVLLFGLIVTAQLLTYVLPQGQFDRVPNPAKPHKMQVVAGTYAPVEERVVLSPDTAFTALFDGFGKVYDIVFFVFVVGGMFAVLRATGAIDALIGRLIGTFGQRPQWIVAGGLLVFAVGSSTIGMAEEYLPFVPVLIVLCVGLGLDAMTAIGILCCGYATGYGVAALNPFTVLIAQPIAGVDPTSGWWYRVVLLVPFLAIAYHHVWRYAKKVLADPQKSLVADLEVPVSKPDSHPAFTGRHFVVLATLFGVLALMVWGIKVHEWYMVQLGGLFLGLTILLAIVGKISPDRTAKKFCAGASELTTTALLIGFANTISIVLEKGQVIDTVINSIATPLAKLPAALGAAAMFVFQSACNVFIPSGSGQAYVTMPIMAPVAELIGVTPQTAVLAYQFGDGFTNILVPTNAVLIGILTMAGIPYDRWLRFILPFMFKVWILGTIALVVAVWIGYA